MIDPNQNEYATHAYNLDVLEDSTGKRHMSKIFYFEIPV